MTFTQAIKTDLIAAIVAKCGITEAEAEKHLKAAKATAKATGLPLADTLKILCLA